MDNFFLSAIVQEMQGQLQGSSVARISLAQSDLMLNLRLPAHPALVASLSPQSPALYISTLVDKPGSSAGQASHPFVAYLQKRISGAKLLSLVKEPTDRIVRIEFERFEASGDKETSTLVISLTGSTSNAYLLDGAGSIEAMLKEREAIIEGTERAPVDLAELLQGLDEQATEEEVLSRFFHQVSILAPIYKREFLARSRAHKPYDAMKSLITDLTVKEPTPLVYSRVRLEEAWKKPLNLKTDLLLSHIELTGASEMKRNQFSTLSEAADLYHRAIEKATALQNQINSLKQSLTTKKKKIEAAINAVNADRKRFEDPDRLKRYGDLLLANLATARVEGATATVIDYYDPQQREVEIEIGEGHTMQQAAVKYFSDYQKGRRALNAIAARHSSLQLQLQPIRDLLSRLSGEPAEDEIAEVTRAAERLSGYKRKRLSETSSPASRKNKLAKDTGRRFQSTDGYEIVVGTNDRVNDFITFRVARPQDIWLHAADYPGSHVVIRNPRRDSVPHRAIIEAAEIAAFYSQAKRESKAAVHYTERKFVTKPPRAKPGLVRLSSFKTLFVEPRCNVERIE